MTRKSWTRIAIAIFLHLPICFANAQKQQSRRVTGRVDDVMGAVISRATVIVLNRLPDQNVRLTVQTDVHGNFTVELPEGGYDILVTSPGFQAAVQTVGISQKDRKLNWKLKALGCNFPGVNCDTIL